jgi:2-dehydro-3-deoxygalactonokinase
MSAPTTPHLLAIDWGTSSLRGALLDAQGQVLDERAFARGILTVPAGQFPAVLNECFGDWMAAHPDLLCLMAGMVGSRQGWLEAPYCACPAGFADIAAQLAWVQPGRIALVPGLSCLRPGLGGDAALATLPDVMRGEETQVFGALQALKLTDARLVLPGTHSKWVQVQGARITAFATFMTGELFALLRQHSILARTLPADDAPFDEAAFVGGVQLALRGPSLLQTAFSTRTLALFERLSAPALASYLSGLVIGEELRAQLLAPQERVVLIGSAALTQRYAVALAQCGVSVDSPGAQVTWAGLHAIAQTLKH